ncbi:hypothetical protein [Mesorhizobium delmotii]|uniref:Lipopolysaccharide assembly protein A domain-containing protein n=1 Tax=Mesorhizobium delmotii TaxID=1631247 RepID=A0A2P9ASB8_9HYPH|nr:hypothetical protein [Mesorhizobium delmotii]SJM34040.1 hypothetical protein BQ8482_380223 [Mesorhizobium delmotii]
MHDLIAFLEANSALVLANPAVFATFAVLFGGGGFLVGRYLLTERIANLESRIARRDEEIADLKGEQKAPKRELPMVPIVGAVATGPGGSSDAVRQVLPLNKLASLASERRFNERQ